MTPGTGADAIVGALIRLGVRHAFGISGANIEDLWLGVQQRRPQITAVLSKHEHSAGTAADAYARLTGSLGVVMTTSGGGAMNLVPALAESRASRVPVLAIVGEPPADLQGRGAFQDTSRRGDVDAQAVFRAVSTFCVRPTTVQGLSCLVEEAGRTALGEKAPAVVLVAKNLQQASCEPGAPDAAVEPTAMCRSAPDPAAISAAALVLRQHPVVIVAGDEVSRTDAQAEVAHLATILDAQVAVTPDARDAFDNGDPRFAGVVGAMGHASAAAALAKAEVCLLIGTRLPLLARQDHEEMLLKRTLVSIARAAPFLSSPHTMHIGGDVLVNVRALVRELDVAARDEIAEARTGLTVAGEDIHEYGSAAILQVIERALPVDAVVLVDAGNTGAHAVHGIRAPRHGRWLLAMGMAGMGYTFGGAIGAAFATGKRVVVLAGDGAFFMHGLEIHTAVEHQLPITYVIFDNRAHGMCLVRERLLLGEESGSNRFRQARIGAGLAAMFPGLDATDCESLPELERAIRRAVGQPGPALVCARLSEVEVPPFASLRHAFAARAAATSGTLS